MAFEHWKFSSPEEPGFHRVVTRQNSEMEHGEFCRVNLPANGRETFETDTMEMGICFVAGSGRVRVGDAEFRCSRLDAVYAPRGSRVQVECGEDETVCYIGAAESDLDIPSYRSAYDPRLPVGDRRQVHGEGAGRRGVFMAIGPQDPACRLIMGYTWSGDGQWTTWPPHQHDEHLEEVYAYFDMPEPQCGLQILFDEDMNGVVAHVVKSGDAIAAPHGYHPTVATPGSRNAYLWILYAKHPPQDRRYDLAVPHPRFG